MATQKAHLVYSYQSPEFDRYEKTPTWYILAGIIAIILLAYAVIEQSPMMFIVILLTFILTLIISNKEPQIITIDITTTGITLDQKKTFQYQDIESFGVFKRGEVQFISLYMTVGILTHTRIPVGKEDPEELAEILSQYIPREDGKESFFDTLDHFLKI